MVKALFDTNILIDYLNGIPQARDELALYDERGISIISWMEVMAGAGEHVEQATRAFLASFTLVGLTAPIADLAVALRRKRPIKLPDAIIEASAQAHHMLLITRDTKDFATDSPFVRVPYTL
ncbi:type II toxin-antitoxin system VapC family toxin [Rhizobium herbae]|uniref:Ribonuclease VapC n=1 Tax=Rhizobium herbae TaxID=508661 RepID=A0ABS4ELJ3_9HYPH|nr:type II toxin-antitoxin system VapC family toxin [Rhizobium herbae]MBP1858783.1 putative nucleic acid-binding protein [Rhizobium herbae]